MTAALIVCVLVYVALLHLVTRHVLIERFEMSVQDQINVVVEQLRKSNAEIVARLAEAEANISSQLVDAGAADAVDLSELTAIAQDLDDIVPDAVVVDPVEEVSTGDVSVDEDAVEVPVGEAVDGLLGGVEVEAPVEVDTLEGELEEPATDEAVDPVATDKVADKKFRR